MRKGKREIVRERSKMSASETGVVGVNLGTLVAGNVLWRKVCTFSS